MAILENPLTEPGWKMIWQARARPKPNGTHTNLDSS